MNEFTKKELETIIDAFNFIYGAPSWRTIEGWDDELQDKIQSMIDNYCEHNESGGEVEIFVDTCSKCNAYLLREFHYDNE